MYLLFYKGTKKENPDSTFWDRFICAVTHSRFSHVELAISETEYRYICWSSSTRDHGVRKMYLLKDSEHWEAVPIESKNISEMLFLQENGKLYDYLGLIGTVIQVPWFSRKRKWFCSEIIAEALGLENSWSYSPEDLYRLYK